MNLAESELQADFYAALNGNIAGWTVYDEAKGVNVSANKRIVIGGTDAIFFGSKTTSGQDLEAQFDFWHKARTKRDVQGTMSSALALLDAHSYSLTGFDVLNVRYSYSTILVENMDEGDPWVHGVLRVRVLIHQQ